MATMARKPRRVMLRLRKCILADMEEESDGVVWLWE